MLNVQLEPSVVAQNFCCEVFARVATRTNLDELVAKGRLAARKPSSSNTDCFGSEGT